MIAEVIHKRAVALSTWLVCLTSLIAPQSAWAGSYDVSACSGGSDNSWTQWADAGMAAYDACPNNPHDVISGIVTRASVGGGSVGYLQGAYQVFTAPPGASLAQMTFDVSPYRWEQHWTVGILAYDDDFNREELRWGCYAGLPGCAIVPGSFWGPTTIALYGHSQVRLEARCGNRSGCTLASSGQYPYTRATISIANVSVRVQDFSQPALSWSRGGLLSGDWLAGVQGVSFDAYDNVGIRETRVSVDGAPIISRGKPCDYSLRGPCPEGGDAYSLDTKTIRPDGPHTLSAEAIDSAGNVGQLSRTILVDNSPSAQPEGLEVDGGEGWRSRNEFRLRWRNPREETAPITGARYELCPTAGGSCQQGSQDGANLESNTLRVPRAGEYVARLWLRDSAGNEDPKTAAQPVALRFDDEPPELAFESNDPADPTRISVRASDAISGVAAGETELRRRGSPAWLSLTTRVEGGHLVARLDDEQLPVGMYELRARATDRAGNERSTDRRTDGQKMELSLPVRAVTHLRAGVAKRSALRGHRRGRHGRGRTHLQTRSHVRFGQGVRIAGRLTNAAGGPVAGAQVRVFEMPREEGASFIPRATLRTSVSGRFSYQASKGPSRTVRVRFPGSAVIRPATQDVEVLVSARTSLRVSRHFALNGETLTFSGRLRGGPIPEDGKLVELQAYARGAWRTFATSEADGHGAWRYPYRFTGTRGRQVYRFRARVPHEASFPYESGYSHRVKVTVVGL